MLGLAMVMYMPATKGACWSDFHWSAENEALLVMMFSPCRLNEGVDVSNNFSQKRVYAFCVLGGLCALVHGGSNIPIVAQNRRPR